MPADNEDINKQLATMAADDVIKTIDDPEFDSKDHEELHAKAIVRGRLGYAHAFSYRKPNRATNHWIILAHQAAAPLTPREYTVLSEYQPTRAAAWKNALELLTQLNAWLLWKAAGEPQQDSLQFWLDAEGNLQNSINPIPPTPPPHE